jgi:hypothetical protein
MIGRNRGAKCPLLVPVGDTTVAHLEVRCLDELGLV